MGSIRSLRPDLLSMRVGTAEADEVPSPGV